MRISCITRLEEIGMPPPEVMVFPEYSRSDEIGLAAARFPSSFVIAAVKVKGGEPAGPARCRGQLWHQGQNRIDYLKIGTDGSGWTIGTGKIPRLPVYELPHICVGVLICMDIQNASFFLSIIDRIRLSKAALKLLCIPADMGSEWLEGDYLMDAHLEGIHVGLCNHTTNHQLRCKSFITDAHRRKIRRQIDCEPIDWELP
jgi:hypothetical protein